MSQIWNGFGTNIKTEAEEITCEEQRPCSNAVIQIVFRKVQSHHLLQKKEWLKRRWCLQLWGQRLNQSEIKHKDLGEDLYSSIKIASSLHMFKKYSS